MLKEATYVVHKPLDHLKSALVKDTVFMRRGSDGQFVFGFALGYILRTVNIKCEELIEQDYNGLDEGLQVYKFSGDIQFLQNDAQTIAAIKQHQGRLFEMHTLYFDGTAESLPSRSGTTVNPDQYTLSRYPLIDNFRKEFGVKFKFSQTSGGDHRRATLSISGITMNTELWSPSSDDGFYAQFPKLDRGLTG